MMNGSSEWWRVELNDAYEPLLHTRQNQAIATNIDSKQAVNTNPQMLNLVYTYGTMN